MFTVRFDWLQGKLFVPTVADLSKFLNDLADLANDQWGLTGRSFSCGQLFRQGFKSVCGFVGGFNTREDGVEGIIQIQGRLLVAVDQLAAIQSLSQSGIKFTRCDIALDDYDKRVTFDEVRHLGVTGHYRLLDTFKYVESCLIKGATPAPTCYFGNSDKIIRFYDAEFVHGIAANRWELQLRGLNAQYVINEYLVAQSCLAAFVVGAIDFGYFANSSFDSFKRALWWESLIREFHGEPIKIPSDRLKPDIFRSANWIREQGGVVLAVLKLGLQDEFEQWMREVCLDGQSRFRNYHREQVNFLRSGKYETKNLYLGG
jgi:hypothetical protein